MKQLVFTSAIITRRSIYQLLYRFDRLFNNRQKLSILCYHSIGKDSWRYGVTLSEFKKQILLLKKTGYSFVSLSDVELFLKKKKKITKPSILLTIDDGYKDNLSLVPFLKHEDITPCLFLLANNKVNRDELTTQKPLLSSQDIRLLINSGWDLGCHSATHSNFATLSDSQLQYEIVESKAQLEKKIGRKITAFAYPKGKYNNKVLSLIKQAKYTLAFSMDDGTITPESDLLTIPRVGVDRTHSLSEFKTLMSPSVVSFRRLLKTTVMKGYYEKA